MCFWVLIFTLHFCVVPSGSGDGQGEMEEGQKLSEPSNTLEEGTCTCTTITIVQVSYIVNVCVHVYTCYYTSYIMYNFKCMCM